MVDNSRTLVFDESGNLGSSGRYFVISCIDTTERKLLHNIMKKRLLKHKRDFPKVITSGFEVKAKDANKTIKLDILKIITREEFKISYIVADLKHVLPRLLVDKNSFYNYLLKLLIDKIVTDDFSDKNINFRLDNKTNKTIKVKSQNSFQEYINLRLNYDRLLNLDIDVKYIDSKSGDGFIVQAADYVANAIYSHYEYNNSEYFNVIKPAIKIEDLFHRDKFGID